MPGETIRIEWMDGRVPKLAAGMDIHDDGTASAGGVETRITEGVLHVYQYGGIAATLLHEWHFPTVNIRVWTKEK